MDGFFPVHLKITPHLETAPKAFDGSGFQEADKMLNTSLVRFNQFIDQLLIMKTRNKQAPGGSSKRLIYTNRANKIQVD